MIKCIGIIVKMGNVAIKRPPILKQLIKLICHGLTKLKSVYEVLTMILICKVSLKKHPNAIDVNACVNGM
jgi:hypothetical protein